MSRILFVRHGAVTFQHACFGFEQDGYAVSYGESQADPTRNKFLFFAVVIEATFADGADEDIEQSGFHAAILKQFSHFRLSKRCFDGMIITVLVCLDSVSRRV